MTNSIRETPESEAAKYTRGPLVVKRAPHSRDECFMVMTPNGIVTTALCYFSKFDDDEPQALADATLYAAAPDLLEALKRLALIAALNINDDPSDEEIESLEAARAAIAKAEGGEQ